MPLLINFEVFRYRLFVGYLMKLAIDFGSTNTVMAWKIYDVDAYGTTHLSTEFNSKNNAVHIPTVMILQSNNNSLDRNYFGADAIAKIHEANNQLTISENFKQLLYNEAPNSENYRKGVELTKNFFAFLLDVCKRDIINKLPAAVSTAMNNMLFLSTPVRADPTHRSLMRNIAKEVGFNSDNNFQEIFTDFDEAACVIKYAIENAPANMTNVGIESAKEKGAIILFVDVGGSTMDMALLSASLVEDNQLLINTVSLWPDADEKYLLGGSLVDKAIRDYLIDKGFAVKDYTLENWIHGDGKFRFRIFKETINDTLKEGYPVTELGMNFFPAICNPYEEMPPLKYGEDKNKLITPDIFENVICQEYVNHMENALRKLFDEQRVIEGKNKVTAADVDAILVSGAGSKLYIIRNVFLRRTNGFSKIIKNPNNLLSEWKIDSSLCCALGALVEKPHNVDMPGYSRDDYAVQVCLYIQSADINDFLRDNPEKLTPVNKQIAVNGNTVFSECIYKKNLFELSKKFQALPVNVSLDETIDYTDYNDGSFDYAMLQIQMLRKNHNEEYLKIGAPFSVGVIRNFGARIRRTVGTFINKITFGKISTNVEVQTSLDLNLQMRLSENYSFTALVTFRGQYFQMGGTIFQMNL